MYKLGLVLLLSASCYSSVYSQNESDSSSWWFGVNGASFINDDYDALPMLSLDYNFKTNNHIRLQVGRRTKVGNMDGDSGPAGNDSIFGGQNIDTTLNTSSLTTKSYAVQLGYYRTVDIGDKGQIYYGLDAIFRKSTIDRERNVKTETEFSPSQIQFFTLAEKSTTVVTRYGLAPMLGFQYNATSRLAFGFEIQSQVLVHKSERDYSRSTLTTFSFSPQLTETDNKGKETRKDDTHELNTLAGLFFYYKL